MLRMLPVYLHAAICDKWSQLCCRFNKEPCFNEMKRVLKPGGVLAIWTTNRAKVVEPLQAAELYTSLILDRLASAWDARALIAEQGHAGQFCSDFCIV